MEKKPEVLVKTLTVKSLIVAIILSVLWPLLLNSFNAYVPHPDHFGGLYSNNYWPFALAFIFILSVLSAASSKLRFTKGELAFIYTVFIMTMVLGLQVGTAGGYTKMLFGVARTIQDPKNVDYVRQYIPPIMGGSISVEALKGIVAGNHPYGWYPVPWGELMTPFIYYTILTVSLWLSLIFAGHILFPLWSEVETLAFPRETALTRLFDWSTEGGEEGSKPTLFKQKILWIGFLIGFLSFTLNIISVYWPPLATYVSMSTGTSIFEYYMMERRLFPIIGSVGYEPWGFGWGLMVPMSVNFTLPLTWIMCCWILFPVLVNLGEFPNPVTATPRFDRWWWQWGSNGSGATALWTNGYGTVLLAIGWGVGLMPLILHWRDLQETVRSKEHRVSAVGYAACTLIFLVMMLVGNIPIHFALIIMAIIFLQYLAYARLLSETGGWLGGIGTGNGAGTLVYQGHFELQALFILTGSGGNPAGAYPALQQGTYWVGGQYWLNAGGLSRSPLPWSLSSYKIGDAVKSPRRHLFIGQIIGIVIAIIFSVYWIYIAYYWSGEIGIGDPRQLTTYAYNISIRSPPFPHTSGGLHTSLDLNTTIVYIVSFAIGAFLVIAQMRFGGIMRFISPAAVYMAGFVGANVWLPFLVCFIVKLLASRMMGTRVVEETLFSLGFGIVIGYAIGWIPATIVGILKGYPIGLGLKWWP